MKHNIELDVYDLNTNTGQAIANQINLKSFPALIADNKVAAVGHPDKQTAEKIITKLTNSK